MVWRASLLTLYPECFPGVLGVSVLGRAIANNCFTLDVHNMRDYSTLKHKQVDDTPAGGGSGMVLRCDVVAAALDGCDVAGRDCYYLSPRGRVFDQKMARQWADSPGVVLICGRFEGIDQRVIDKRNLIEVSLGDFVLCGGEVAAMAMLEATVRCLPGVLGNSDSLQQESFSENLLEYPQYTRPAQWEGTSIPHVLLEGHHQKIRAWRQQQSEIITQNQRPDLWKRYCQTEEND